MSIDAIGSNSGWQSMQGLQGMMNRPKPPSPEEMMKQMDGDGNGTISLDEFKTDFEKKKAEMDSKMGSKGIPSAGEKGQPPSAEDMFNSIDTDGDGKITMEELQTDMENRKTEMDSKMNAAGMGLQQSQDSSASGNSNVTNEIDTDGDGKISLEELQAYLEKKKAETDKTLSTTYSQTGTSTSSNHLASLLNLLV